jgi:hypothetical protein
VKKVSRLTSVLLARESGEKDALRAHHEVERIVTQRRRVVDELKALRAGISDKLREFLENKRVAALQEGNLNRLSALTGYGKRLSRELKRIEQELELREIDLKRAIERSDIAEEEFHKARVERKKVEHVIEGQRQSNRVLDIARDEALQDELRNLKKGR